MEQAKRFTTAARLHAVGVVGLVPTSLAYRPYPVVTHAKPTKATWRMNRISSIHAATMGPKKPSSLN